MLKLEVYRTHDLALHLSKRDALRHLDNLYGIEIVNLARVICAAEGKYTRTLGILEDSHETFTRLKTIKDDMQVIEQENEL